MIKILILSIIIVLSTVVGYLLSTNKKKRAAVFAELYEFNEQLLLNLKYGRVRIEALTAKYKYVNEVIAGKDVLSGDDDVLLKNYAKNLGSTDPQSQIDYLNERKVTVKKLADESQRDYKRYGSLYVKIGLMVGILIAVLLA